MNIALFIFLLFLLQSLYWFVGASASEDICDKDDYFLAGKRVTFFPLLMTFIATQVGGGTVLGATEEAYQYGWIVILYPLGSALGLILLGLGIGRKLMEFGVSTIAEIFEVVYRSKTLRKIASILSILSLFMILVGQLIASKKFLMTLGLTNPYLFVLFWSIVIIYTSQGGLKGVIATDLVQAAFFSLVFCAGFAFALYFSTESLVLPAQPFENLGEISAKLTGWLILPLLFIVIEQDMGQRCFAGETVKIVNRAAIGAGILTFFLCLIPLTFGLWAKSASLDVPDGQSVLMVAISTFTNPTIAAFVGCAILAAVISTATSLISAISSNLNCDFEPAASRLEEKSLGMKRAKIITALIGIAAIFCSFYFNSIVGTLMKSYELAISALFVPIVAAFFNKNGNKWAAALSMLFGSLAFLYLQLNPIRFSPELVALACSWIGYGCGAFLSDETVTRKLNWVNLYSKKGL